MKKKLIDRIREKLDFWESEGLTTGKQSVDSRMIIANGDDEDPYSYFDEVLESFIKQELQNERNNIIDEVEKIVAEEMAKLCVNVNLMRNQIIYLLEKI